MAFPIKICAVCHEEFELKPDKPGFANRCPECSAPETTAPISQHPMDPMSARIEEKPMRLGGKRCANSYTARTANRCPI